MPIYRYSIWTSYGTDEGASDAPCVVRIDGPEIVVDYEGENAGERLYYKGHEVSDGHYELTNPSAGGTATLHRFRDSLTLEGSWKEAGYRGMWTIELSDEE